MKIFERQFQDISSSKEVGISIYFATNEISFCAYNAYSGKLYYVAKHYFDNEIEQNIVKELFQMRCLTNELPVAEYNVSIFAPEIFLTPLSIMEESNTTIALETIFSKKSGGRVSLSDNLDKSNISIAWGTEKSIYNIFKQADPQVKINSSHTSYFKKISEIYDPYILSNSIFLNFESNYFSLTRINKNKIDFFNIYLNEGYESILYQILSALQANHLNPQNSEIIYSGCNDLKIISQLRKYIKTVNPLEMIILVDQIDQKIESDFIQENFNLLSLSKCE